MHVLSYSNMLDMTLFAGYEYGGYTGNSVRILRLHGDMARLYLHPHLDEHWINCQLPTVFFFLYPRLHAIIMPHFLFMNFYGYDACFRAKGTNAVTPAERAPSQRRSQCSQLNTRAQKIPVTI